MISLAGLFVERIVLRDVADVAREVLLKPAALALVVKAGGVDLRGVLGVQISSMAKA
jgi:hypothetical protein